ncbi:hypothetical protein GCM10010515_50160 [Streptomyces fructofermentans]|uniref:Uncharacterized protein n=1 Tax=Streptomyces fructofermentans TaxID=152141 RepID=A0A918KW64_9ACTN|nr:hypothetical protein GCM10010515_50160 [Streptomyces fructofermentans]
MSAHSATPVAYTLRTRLNCRTMRGARAMGFINTITPSTPLDTGLHRRAQPTRRRPDGSDFLGTTSPGTPGPREPPSPQGQ